MKAYVFIYLMLISLNIRNVILLIKYLQETSKLWTINTERRYWWICYVCIYFHNENIGNIINLSNLNTFRNTKSQFDRIQEIKKRFPKTPKPSTPIQNPDQETHQTAQQIQNPNQQTHQTDQQIHNPDQQIHQTNIFGHIVTAMALY